MTRANLVSRLREINSQMDSIVEAGGRMLRTDPLFVEKRRILTGLKK